MDTSEKYIKMCNCEGIWGYKTKLDFGDYYVDYEYGKPKVELVSHPNGRLRLYSEHWLPRQDQLQEMVLAKERYQSDFRVGDLSRDLVGFIDWLLDAGLFSKVGGSMEQLWLAFVMKEKWNKVWSGEEWALP
jgi:hypothetical protein